jgi:hypothetical protein
MLFVIGDLPLDRLPCLNETEERLLVQSSSRIRPLNASQIPYCIGLPAAMKNQATPLSWVHASMAFDANSVPRRGDQRSRAHCRANATRGWPRKQSLRIEFSMARRLQSSPPAYEPRRAHPAGILRQVREGEIRNRLNLERGQSGEQVRASIRSSVAAHPGVGSSTPPIRRRCAMILQEALPWTHTTE